jgi:hypothetical protein
VAGCGLRQQVVERPAHVALEVNLDRTGEDQFGYQLPHCAESRRRVSQLCATSCGSLAILAAMRLASAASPLIAALDTLRARPRPASLSEVRVPLAALRDDLRVDLRQSLGGLLSVWRA